MTDQYTSQSSIENHRSCPQKWYYGSIRRLKRTEDIAIERDFGSWAHTLRAAESIDRGRRLGSLKQTPDELWTTDDGPVISTDAEGLTDRVLAACTTWWEKQSEEYQTLCEEKIGERMDHRLAYVFARWQGHWAEDIEKEHPLGVEVHWERRLPALPQPDGTEKDPETTLVGYVDEIYYDTSRSMVIVRDHKFSKSLGTQSTADDMMESQLQIYAWGAAPLVATWDVGPIRATAYDRSRMVKPRTPVLTQMGSLSKSVTDYDLHTYREFAEGGVEFPGRTKDGSQAGVYEIEPAVVERLSTPQAKSIWFQRTLSPLNKNIVRTHLRGAVDTSLDMRSTRERGEITGQAGRNLSSWNCRWCDFASLCRYEMVGGVDSEYDIADFGLTSKAR